MLVIAGMVIFPGIGLYAAATALTEPSRRLAVDDGYRGIWYFNHPTKDE